MYLPSHFSESSRDAIRSIMQAHPLVSIVRLVDGQIEVDHAPLLFVDDGSEHGLLRCHVARANPLWQQIGAAQGWLVIFNGPNGYISPSFYPSKATDPRHVPTWNFTAIHARVEPRVVSPEHTLAVLREQTDAYETGRNPRWTLDESPEDYLERLSKAVVAIDMPILSIEAKFKQSQNRSPVDRAGVADALRESDPEMAALVARPR